ncbi:MULTISPECIES: NUDIX hydrolase [Enterococcus]|uniref:NUDIX hydrolase n=1 Tax=Enterococcus TaxID=1350 RepID=UPI00065DD7A2|nr:MULTISPECIES: NUDIX hydrolase [Enterococcus]KAF1303449.1 NUDIX hydrolase [Enterococcus sp. JM9B]
MKQPIFGKKEKDKPYKARFGAYVVIENENELVLVQAPNGAFFLPGGEIEAGESHEMAINREMLEELGFTVTIGSYLGEAIEYFYSSHRDTYYHHPGYFYAVTSWEKVAEPTETTNNISWHSIDDAMLLLKRGSHRWAVQQWLKQKNR